MGVLLGHLSQDPVSPSERLGRAVPPELERILLRCLEKDPEHRYSGARALYHELQGLPSWNRSQAAAWWAEQSGS